jgi:all-trans-8'-apo-beta-carotenal 15,15'-oxygenase
MEDAVTTTHGWRGGLMDLRREHGFEPLEVEGRVPVDLCGTLYRNGPGRFEMGDRSGVPAPIDHWFDGMGAVSGVRFAPDGVSGAVRLIAPPSLETERTSGTRTHWGFGTAPNGWWRRLLHRSRNSANTNVVAWGDRLFALYEGNLPTEVHPNTLETIDEVDLDGVIPQCFSAHPHRVDARAALYGFGVRWAMRPMLDVFELPDAGPARRLCSLPLDGIPLLHDFAATERHLIFIVPPVRLDRWRQLWGLGTPRDNLHWHGHKGTEIIVIPIDAPDQVRRFTTDPFWMWHTANAYETADGEIVVDMVRYDSFDTLDWLDGILADRPKRAADGFLSRLRIDTRGGSVTEERLSDIRVEFPRVDPRHEGAQHSQIWTAAHSSVETAAAHIQDGIAVVDVARGQDAFIDLGADTYCSEPVVVSRPDTAQPDDAWVLSLGYDAAADRSFVAIVDAARPTEGPVAKVWYDQPVPYTFHGNFVAPVR